MFWIRKAKSVCNENNYKLYVDDKTCYFKWTKLKVQTVSIHLIPSHVFKQVASAIVSVRKITKSYVSLLVCRQGGFNTRAIQRVKSYQQIANSHRWHRDVLHVWRAGLTLLSPSLGQQSSHLDLQSFPTHLPLSLSRQFDFRLFTHYKTLP